MSGDEVTSVLVIDDHPLLRKGVDQLLALDDGLTLVGEAVSGEEGLELARRLAPDIILLDLNMAGMGGHETLRALKTQDPEARVVVLTVSDDEKDVVAALRAGAEGYLLKDMEPEAMLASLHDVAAGKLTLSPRVVGLLGRALRQEALPRTPHEAGLTEREVEVLAALTGGGSNKVIARQLAISEGTVKVHMKNILKKLRLNSRTEAAVWGVSHVPGLAPTDTEASR
ncbi:MAG: two-component system response regulator NarL [Gammaproteobacteria bacterium]|nr:two-component system response regulator NarL [Gammaproteobacteria bacterium]